MRANPKDVVKRIEFLHSAARYYHFIYGKKKFFFCLLCIVAISSLQSSLGQAGITDDLKKPAKYENRTLGYEKTDQTKFKVPRRFVQNTITHYNYYFNANNKLNEILTRAKAQNKDDYTQLISFYNYSLDITARDKRNLDSLLDKINTVILIRDLRNDWNDNLYMLMGQAYYYKKELDSASITFQFVNYAYAPKDKDGYQEPIGSNSGVEERGQPLTISTNEKRNIVKKTFSLPPSRNESFIWQIRTFITKGQMSKAASLIEILKHDPQFPARLNPSLQEMQAYWFYKQDMYDSAAGHLILALDNANNKLELARWEFLIGQLYQKSGKHDLAREYFEKAVQHTYDPVLDVYARLNAIRENKGKSAGENFIRDNVRALEKMAKKDVYAGYQDIIYYAAAEMELERKDRNAAINFLLKSAKYASPNSSTRDKAFILLGDMAMEDKRYKSAKSYYDSVNVSDFAIAENLKTLQDKKRSLLKIVAAQNTIERQDSLQRIAAMPEEERNTYIKKLVRTLRKQQGLREEEQTEGQNFSFNSSNNAGGDLFGTNASGDWYFNNNAIKARGFSDFKSKWGNRPNADNWRVSSLVARQRIPSAPGQGNQGVAGDNAAPQQSMAAISSEALLANLPLTPAKLQKSQDSIENALFNLGRAYQDEIPDYPSAINSYDSLLVKFPSSKYYEETLFHLYYCYKKMGDEVNAKRILDMMQQRFAAGKFTKLLTDPNATDPDKVFRTDATRQYEQVYSDFIEGNFELALNEKKTADSLYGEKYWTPQLLYIEAVYYVHIRMDSLAIAQLTNITRKYPKTGIAAKAQNMMDVLKRRKQLEEYLSNLKIERAKEDTVAAITSQPAAAPKEITQKEVKVERAKSDSGQLAKVRPKVDSASAAKKLPVFASVFSYTPDKPHGVAILMNKVDPVYVTESKNAFNRYNRENYYSQTFDITGISINDTLKMVVINSFGNADSALAYMEKAQKLAPREIIPWLPPSKYTIFIITPENLELLRNNKDFAAYKKFLSAYFPGKF
ncbi:MAG: hypothetical protein C5B59_04180 [Bacteroidetes bacterium]|nr:MAG: hypothetical protein C5B59_04180 [Bacteroidota bacterium]